MNFIHKIRGLWWSLEHLNVPTKPWISPSKRLNKKNICNLRTSEIPNNVIYEGKQLESNCSVANKSGIDKTDNSCNTLRKLRVNNPLRIFVGELNINSIKKKSDVFCNIL